MPVAPIYLDECVRHDIAPPLRLRGIQVTTALDVGMTSVDDSAQLAYATQLEIRIVMMLDWIALRPDHRSQLFRWHDLQYWLTQGNRLAGYTEAEVRLALGQRS